MRKFFIIILLFGVAMLLRAQELKIYSVPNELLYTAHNDDYTVRVRKPGGEWQDLFEYNVNVDLDKPQDASMVTFDFSGSVEVMVRKNNGNVQAVKIRPALAGVVPQVSGNITYFTLNKPSKLSIEFDGDKLHNLHLFANSLESNIPDLKDHNVIYFGPGTHTPPDKPGNVFKIPSGKTVYIAGGAVIRGKLVCDHAENVRIIGRGIIDHPERGIEITNSRNVEVDGLIVINPKHYTVYGGQSDNIVIRNLKIFSSGGWTDGIDLMSCSDVAIDDVFLRTSDDCIAIYGHRWDYYGNARNCKITNSVLWADVAHPTTIGLHGNTNHVGDTIENILFRNIDILEHDEDDPEYQGCLAINAGDLNLVRNVRYENIRIDDFEEGQLVHLKVCYNTKYNAGPGRGIENIYFKDINYTGINCKPSLIDGWDKIHTVRNVGFENLRINGKVMTDAASANIKAGVFTTDISFKK
ncbi:MAG: glycosyl hydrolase family 28 protein [Bacteroidota bacterium]|nr:glycosyl hydrolase family 28 protein [Bacteroidota bacterium]